MDLVQAIVLGAIQGLTEFIPISSSGHLVVVPALLGWPEQSLAFDTVLHLGTLLAVLAYFRDDWLSLAAAWLASVRRLRVDSPEERLAWLVILGCVPAAVAGFLLEDWFAGIFDQPAMVGYFLLATAATLTLAEVLSRRERDLSKLGLAGGLLIGLAQALAILPGVSRSGSTIATGMLLGLTRPASARFSFLLAGPIIFGAGLSQVPDAVQEANGDAAALALLAGFVAAAVVGYLCISLLLRYLRRNSLYPFAAYCAAFGLVVIFTLGRVAG